MPDKMGGRVMQMHSAREQYLIERMKKIQARWGWLLALGVVLVLVGIAALGATVVATLATVTFLGVVLLVGGLLDVVSSFTSRAWRGFGLSLVTGILATIVGLMFVARPAAGAGVLTLLLVVMLLVNGVARIVYSAAERFPSWGWSFTSGVVAVLLGVWVLARFPTSAFWVLGVVVAVELLFRGTMWMALAFALRGTRSRGRGGADKDQPAASAQPEPGAV